MSREFDGCAGRTRAAVAHALLETLGREPLASHAMSSQPMAESSGSRRTASSISGNAALRSLP
ncbi:hypothetical protein [Streptomyces sp. NPDC051001]|uniref:hypothetical protein n=1 Tax=Streptomyces sp. NPDC051001 TaxID=3155795 RepID=UPI00341B5F15